MDFDRDAFDINDLYIKHDIIVEFDPEDDTQLETIGLLEEPVKTTAVFPGGPDSYALTVGELKAYLDSYPDTTQVVLDDGNEWYVNVRAVGLPTTADGYMAITLFQGAVIDTRQW